MKKFLLIIGAAIALAFASAPSNAAEESQIELAQRFIKALETGDLATAEQMIGQQVTFEDPTFGVSHSGRDQVLEVYENYTGGARVIHKHLLSAYESSNTVVLNYIFYVEMNVAPSGTPENYMSLMAEGARVIRFKGGKVVHHMDLANYTAVNDAIEQASPQ